MPACRKCLEDVSRMESSCPECGYNPGSVIRRTAIGVLFFGGALGLLFPPVLVFSLFLALVLFGWSVLATPAG